MSNPMLTARLEIIAAKSRILVEKSRNNQFWPGELSRGLSEIEREISNIQTEEGLDEKANSQWSR